MDTTLYKNLPFKAILPLGTTFLITNNYSLCTSSNNAFAQIATNERWSVFHHVFCNLGFSQDYYGASSWRLRGDQV